MERQSTLKEHDYTMESSQHGWKWAYQKARGYHVSAVQAFYRATRFWLIGDTGTFLTHGGFRKSRIRR